MTDAELRQVAERVAERFQSAAGRREGWLEYLQESELLARRLLDLMDERAKLHAILADKNGNHRGCGCDGAPLHTMASDLVFEVEQLQAENKLLREATAPGDVWCHVCGAIMAKDGDKFRCPTCDHHYELMRVMRKENKALRDLLSAIKQPLTEPPT